MSMVGVAHQFRRSSVTWYWMAFLIGLTMSALAIGTFMESIVRPVVPRGEIAVAGVTIALILMGLADLLGKPLSISRQTPQVLTRRLASWRLGGVYGVDVGLVVTTQNVTSTIFAAVAISFLSGGSVIFVMLVYVGAVMIAAVVEYRVEKFRGEKVDRLRPRSKRYWQFASALAIMLTIPTISS